MLLAVTFPKLSYQSLWRNRLARSAVNRKVGGSSPPRDDSFLQANQRLISRMGSTKQTKMRLGFVIPFFVPIIIGHDVT